MTDDKLSRAKHLRIAALASVSMPVFTINYADNLREEEPEDRGCDCSAMLSGNSGPHSPGCPMHRPVSPEDLVSEG